MKVRKNLNVIEQLANLVWKSASMRKIYQKIFIDVYSFIFIFKLYMSVLFIKKIFN